MAFFKNAGLTKLISLTRNLISKNARIVSEALNSLAKRIDALENIDNYGDVKADSIDTMEYPRVAGNPIVLQLEGTPSTNSRIPDFRGQLYIDTTTGVVYYATNNESVSNWIRLTATSTYSSSGTEPVNGAAVNEATQKDSVPTKDSTKLLSSGTVYANEQVLVESINEIRQDVDALKDIKRFDTLECNTIQSMSIPKVGDSEMILNGEGAPSLEPEFVGQAYLDTTNNILYYAFGTETTSWKSSQPTEIITDSVVNEIWNGVFV